MQWTSVDIVNQAITNLMLGFGLALLNVVVRYFVPGLPRVISVLRWSNRTNAIIGAYLIALVLQLATSPLFRSLLHSVYAELAWSPYQAIFNVLGVILMDLLVMAVTGVRRGAELGRQQFDSIKAQASEGLDAIGDRLALTPESREEQAAQLKAQQEAETQAATERKKRVDDRLKKY